MEQRARKRGEIQKVANGTRGAFITVERVVLNMQGRAAATVQLVAPRSPTLVGEVEEERASVTVEVDCENRLTEVEAEKIWAHLRDITAEWLDACERNLTRARERKERT